MKRLKEEKGGQGGKEEESGEGQGEGGIRKKAQEEGEERREEREEREERRVRGWRERPAESLTKL